MLNTYLAQTQQLLQNPQASSALYSTSDLTSYINRARVQVAGDGECIRVQGTLALAATTNVYNFSSVVISSVSGLAGILNVRQAILALGAGYKWLTPRGWEWFTLYHLNNPAPVAAMPEVWSQFAQGNLGSLYFDPTPDAAYSLLLDCVCYPAALATDSDPEPIPVAWTDAVPYYAAYLALLSAQAGVRQADAARMFGYYEEFKNRARRFSNSSVLPYNQPQSPDPVQANRLGLNAPKAGGAQ